MPRGPLLGEAAVIAFRYRFLSTTRPSFCPASPNGLGIAHIVHLLSAGKVSGFNTRARLLHSIAGAVGGPVPEV